MVVFSRVSLYLTKMEMKNAQFHLFLLTTGSKFHEMEVILFTSGSNEHPKFIVYTYAEMYRSNAKNFSHSTGKVDFPLVSGVIVLYSGMVFIKFCRK